MNTAAELPDLWPETVKKSRVRSPLTILKFYSEQLTRYTGGIIRGEIVTQASKNKILHYFDVIAPAGGQLRRRLFNVAHEADSAYPVWLYGPDSMSANSNSEPEFLDHLGQVLSSPEVVAVIQSLIARSNESTVLPADSDDSVLEPVPR
jgi:hypothetical protein